MSTAGHRFKGSGRAWVAKGGGYTWVARGGGTRVKGGGQGACALEAGSAMSGSDPQNPAVAGRHPDRPYRHTDVKLKSS
jgi:hypothetical protein